MPSKKNSFAGSSSKAVAFFRAFFFFFACFRASLYPKLLSLIDYGTHYTRETPCAGEQSG